MKKSELKIEIENLKDVVWNQEAEIEYLSGKIKEITAKHKVDSAFAFAVLVGMKSYLFENQKSIPENVLKALQGYINAKIQIVKKYRSELDENGK